MAREIKDCIVWVNQCGKNTGHDIDQLPAGVQRIMRVRRERVLCLDIFLANDLRGLRIFVFVLLFMKGFCSCECSMHNTWLIVETLLTKG